MINYGLVFSMYDFCLNFTANFVVFLSFLFCFLQLLIWLISCFLAMFTTYGTKRMNSMLQI